MRLVVLVPRRSDGGHRDRLWRFCSARWEAEGFEVVEGHDDSDEPFNRSRALNRAAEAAGDWDAAFLCDSDLVVRPIDHVCRAADRAVETGRIIYPHDRYLYVNEDVTADILDSDGPDVERWNRQHVLFRFWVRHGYARACPVIPRPLWDAIGGMDERFVGWGPEDHAMVAAATTLGGPFEILNGGHLFHLWHSVEDRPTDGDPHYDEACRLFHRYKAADGDVSAMRALLDEKETAGAR